MVKVEFLNDSDIIYDGDIRHVDDLPSSFRVSDEQYIDEDDMYEVIIGDYEKESYERAQKDLEKIRETQWPKVDLGMRAVNLMTALNEYARGNGLGGFLATEKPRNVQSTERARDEAYRNANNALKDAYGYQDMIKNGIDTKVVEEDYIQMRADFRDKYLRPADKKAANARKRHKTLLKKFLPNN